MPSGAGAGADGIVRVPIAHTYDLADVSRAFTNVRTGALPKLAVRVES